MKTFINLTIILLVSLYSLKTYSIPDYSLKAANFKYVSANIIEFDIYVLGNFLYKNGEYVFNFNPAIANGGTLTFTKAPGALSSVTDLPYEPHGKSYVTGAQIRFHCNPFVNSVTISDTTVGKKIRRMKLQTTAPSFSGTFSDMGITWDISSPLYQSAVYYEDENEYVKPANVINTVLLARGLGLSWNLQAMTVQDTMSVFLRESFPPFALIDESVVYPELFSGYFRSNIIFNRAAENNYYVITKHRNSLETWSSSPVAGNTSYNFTSSLSNAYGDNMILVNGLASFYSGDVEGNGFVNLNDIIKIYNDVIDFVTGYEISDLDGDNTVGLNDLLTGYNNAKNFVSVKKP